MPRSARALETRPPSAPQPARSALAIISALAPHPTVQSGRLAATRVSHQFSQRLASAISDASASVRKASIVLYGGVRGWLGWAGASFSASHLLAGDSLDDAWPRTHPLSRVALPGGQRRTPAARLSVPLSRRIEESVRRRWLLVVLTVLVLAFALGVTSRVLASVKWPSAQVPGALATNTASDAPIVLHQPTPAAPRATLSPIPPYLIGVWMKNDLPAPSGSDTIYVRVTVGASQRPGSGISVTASVTFTCATRATVSAYGPVVTGADGVAAIPIRFAGLPVGKPVCVVVTAHTDKGTFSATTGFAASGSEQPSPTATPTMAVGRVP